jgi:hypothetical protein
MHSLASLLILRARYTVANAECITTTPVTRLSKGIGLVSVMFVRALQFAPFHQAHLDTHTRPLNRFPHKAGIPPWKNFLELLLTIFLLSFD